MTLIPLSDWAGPGRLLRLDAEGTGTPVLITHGTFSNAETCQPIAEFFGARPVYVIEWRGRDLGANSIERFNYNDLANTEMHNAIEYLGSDTHVIAHSGGGLAMILALHHHPHLRARVRSLTCLAAQATHTRTAPFPYWISLNLIRRIYHRRGYWPVDRMRIGPCNESAGILEHWMEWGRMRRFTDENGLDILPSLAGWSLPALMIAGKADHHIAAASGIQAIAHAFGATGRYHLADASSDGEDFTHARLFRSRAATGQLWPRIASFMDEIDGGLAAA